MSGSRLGLRRVGSLALCLCAAFVELVPVPSSGLLRWGEKRGASIPPGLLFNLLAQQTISVQGQVGWLLRSSINGPV